MEREALQAQITAINANVTFEEGGEMLNAFVDPKECRDLLQTLHNMDDLAFDYMFCLTCVDWKTHLTMVYHLESTKHRHVVVIKSKLDRENPEIEYSLNGIPSGIYFLTIHCESRSESFSLVVQ